MNYQEARDFIDEASQYGSVYGLESIRGLLDRLSNPQNDLKIVHIAGTNGKGSTIAFLNSILRSAGYRTGRYISPTVVSYRERIRVGEEYITREAFAEHIGRIAEVVAEIVKEGRPHPTAFEIETAAAFLYFQACKCDIVLLETGLGGTMDATNIIENPICAVLTSISMDHMAILGDTLSEIGKNKAGIIKPGAIAVTLDQAAEVMEAIDHRCAECACMGVIADRGNVYGTTTGPGTIRFSYQGQGEAWEDLEIRMTALYQVDNAVLALEAAEVLQSLGWNIKREHVYEGLGQAVWGGRFTRVMDCPEFYIDGAHNEGAAARLKETLEARFAGRRIIYIMGVLADKEYDKIAGITAPLAERIITITPDNPRALQAELLAETVSRFHGNVAAAESLEEAVSTAIHAAGEDGVIIAFGSLSYLGDLLKVVEKRKEAL